MSDTRVLENMVCGDSGEADILSQFQASQTSLKSVSQRLYSKGIEALREMYSSGKFTECIDGRIKNCIDFMSFGISDIPDTEKRSKEIVKKTQATISGTEYEIATLAKLVQTGENEFALYGFWKVNENRRLQDVYEPERLQFFRYFVSPAGESVEFIGNGDIPNEAKYHPVIKMMHEEIERQYHAAVSKQ